LGFNRAVRVFMGDAGSTFLGLVIAAIGIALCQGRNPVMAPAIGLWLIAVPVFDLFAAVVRRLMDGVSPFAPDHEHLHHVLMEHGLSTRGTLGVMLSLAALFASIGVAGNAAAMPDGVMVLGWFAAFAFYYQLMRHPRVVVRIINAVSRAGTAPPFSQRAK